MKKILVVTPFEIFPPYWGAASRIYNLVKCLSAYYEVTVLYNGTKKLHTVTTVDNPLLSNPNVKPQRIRACTRYSQAFNPILIIRGLSMCLRNRYSVIISATAWSGFNSLCLSLITHTPCVLDEHNVEFITFGRTGRWGRAGVIMLKLYERILCKLSRRIICVSEQDRDSFISYLNVDERKLILAPNGVDEEIFRPDTSGRSRIRANLGITGDTPLILFNGKLDYRPNIEAVSIIRKHILPGVLKEMPHARFLVIGSNPPLEFSHDNITFIDIVDHIEDYINASDVVICPLLSGGGTRLKILEAIACGRNVISTTIGAEGIIRTETWHHLKCADNWDLFVQEIIHAIKQRETSSPEPGFFDLYSWRNIAARLRSDIDDLA